MIVELHPEGFLQENTIEETADTIEADTTEFLHVVFSFVFIRENSVTPAAESDDELNGGVVRLTVGSAKHVM